MMDKPQIYTAIGMMSGTSLDGVDAAVIVTDGETIDSFGATAFRPYTPVERATLRAALAAYLPDYMVPAALVVLETLPLSPSGKLDRRDLPEPELSGTADYEPPATPDEALLCRLFAELTGAARVSVTDSFFALGGHSLLAMRLVARLRAERGLELPLRALFAHPSPRALARDLATAATEQRWLEDAVVGSGK